MYILYSIGVSDSYETYIDVIFCQLGLPQAGDWGSEGGGGGHEVRARPLSPGKNRFCTHVLTCTINMYWTLLYYNYTYYTVVSLTQPQSASPGLSQSRGSWWSTSRPSLAASWTPGSGRSWGCSSPTSSTPTRPPRSRWSAGVGATLTSSSASRTAASLVRLSLDSVANLFVKWGRSRTVLSILIDNVEVDN